MALAGKVMQEQNIVTRVTKYHSQSGTPRAGRKDPEAVLVHCL